MEPSAVGFRNGRPPQVSWAVFIKKENEKLYRKKRNRYLRLDGEIVTFHKREGENPIDNLTIDLDMKLVVFKRKKVKIFENKQLLIKIYCSTPNEAENLAKALHKATKRKFQKCYYMGHRISALKDMYTCSDVNIGDFMVKAMRASTLNFQQKYCLERERLINTIIAHEDKASAVLERKCLVKAVDIFNNSEYVYIVFQPYPNGTVRGLLMGGPLNENNAKAVMRDVFLALHYIHAKHIVHRDINPDNLFIQTESTKLKCALGNFSISGYFPPFRAHDAVLSTMIGAPPYTAPEIWTKQKYGPSVDLWSAGITMFELLTGQVPYHADSYEDTMQLAMNRQLVFPKDYNKHVSKQAQELIMCLVQRDPRNRIKPSQALYHPWFGFSDQEVLQLLGNPPSKQEPRLSFSWMFMSGTFTLPSEEDEDEMETEDESSTSSDSSEELE